MRGYLPLSKFGFRELDIASKLLHAVANPFMIACGMSS